MKLKLGEIIIDIPYQNIELGLNFLLWQMTGTIFKGYLGNN